MIFSIDLVLGGVLPAEWAPGTRISAPVCLYVCLQAPSSRDLFNTESKHLLLQYSLVKGRRLALFGPRERAYPSIFSCAGRVCSSLKMPYFNKQGEERLFLPQIMNMMLHFCLRRSSAQALYKLLFRSSTQVKFKRFEGTNWVVLQLTNS